MRNEFNINEFEFGKIPPQAIDLEEAVLGAILLEKDAIIEVVDILKPEVFYKDSHQIIFSAIIRLYGKSEPIDILTVTNELKKIEKLDYIGRDFLSKLTSQITSSMVVNIDYHSKIIVQKYMQRELIRLSNEISQKAYDDTFDVFELINDYGLKIQNIENLNVLPVWHIETCVKDVLKIIDNNNSGALKGILTGFKDYDDFSKGDHPGDLIIVCGESSQGKTAFSLCKAFNQALMGYNVVIFSYEMTKDQITARLMALTTEISSSKILMDKLQFEEIEKIHSKIQKLIETNIFIIEPESSELSWLVSKIKSLKIKHDIDCVTVDYAQLVKVKGMKRNEEVAEVANTLKFIAKHPQIKIPITLVSQLRRDGDKHEPELWRLKESGDLENAADTVIGIWHPYRFGRDEMKIRISEGNFKIINTSGLAVAHVLKGRNIGLKDVVLRWNPALTKFYDYTDEIPF